ncbi:AraC family transcriptional regulator [Alteromonas sediminis]|uniref:AraC family transcriptional regulator n=1 Tax=Alteromonas sediminis TaxID=2259342 RepID=A0A3N5Z5Z3_9ALTE|nr:AraC family transcriptional regulator [Alteromonas sediminis]RPJ65834.1 AraC family transcriptional regulator [Alteromonas sediminis]
MGFDVDKRVSTKISDHPVGKLLNGLRMESAFFTHSTLRQPWALSMPVMANCMMFHLVLEGEAHFQIDGESFKLNKGEFVLFPQGDGHWLSDGHCCTYTALHDLPIQAVTERYETLEYGGNGEETTLICGVMLFQHPLAIKILGILPDKIVIDASQHDSSHVVNTMSALIGNEAKSIDVGAEAVIARLADIIVIAAMREHLGQLGDSELGWLNALQDDRIGKAMTLIHDKPAKHWSLEELALAVGMSRTSFAQQFKKLVGNSPMEYLTEWRLSLAYSQLQLSKDSMLSIALEIGYQSEAAFSRAFKKVIGKSPSEVRKAYQIE